MNKEVVHINLSALTPFSTTPSNHRLKELSESIKTNGVMSPIIVRPIAGEQYAVLSGHNRVEAAKLAGLEEIPAIVRYELTDDEAMLVVTETNLIQRSFADMSYSEKAAVLTARHDALCQQGKRTDLIKEVNELLEPARDADLTTFSHVEQKSRTHDTMSAEFGLSRASIARYIRVDGLTEALKARLDANEIAFISAVSLSFLTEDEQIILDEILTASDLKITSKNSEELRERSGKLNRAAIENILKGASKKKRLPNAKWYGSITKVVDRYFKDGQKAKEIEKTIEKALKFYFGNTEMAAEFLCGESYYEIESD